MSDFHSSRKILKDLLDREELVNGVILTEDDGRFPVHLEVLASMSPYFMKVITAARDKQWDNILIPGVSKDTMSNVINFMYTGKVELSLDTVNALARTGEFFEMPELVELCKKFLLSIMTEANCIIIYMFAKYFQYGDLKAKARAFITANFKNIFPSSPDFLNLQVDDLVAILTSDSLNVQSEESVFLAIMRWIEKDRDARHTYLPNLVRCLRLGLCPFQFYERNIWPNLSMTPSDECQAIVLQASHMYADIPSASVNPRNPPVLNVRHPFLRPRTPHEIIFVMGGWSAGSATNIIETYDIKSKRWFLSANSDTIPRAYHGMIWHKGHIYLIGGFDGNQCFNSVRRYDPANHIWEEKGCMYVQRCYVSVASVGDHIYAMGGYDGHRRNNTCERYDPATNQWEMVAQMNQTRSDASADSINGKIYIAGGFNGTQVLDSVECYDPETDSWTMISTMSSPRSGVKLVTYYHHLFVIGGFNGNNRLNTVEKFNPITRAWSQVATMNTPRSNFATAVVDGCLYVIGGFNGLTTISAAESYSYQRNEWENVTELNLNRSALAACTVSGIPNAHEYSYLGNVPCS